MVARNLHDGMDAYNALIRYGVSSDTCYTNATTQSLEGKHTSFTYKFPFFPREGGGDVKLP